MKIMLIEHNRGLLFSLKRFLESHKHQVEEAFDGVIALNRFDESFNLVIIDGDIPRVPCTEIVSLAKEKNEDVKVIVLYNDYAINEDLLVSNTNIEEFLTRPFSPNELLEAIKRLSIKKNSSIYLTNREYLILEKLRQKEIVDYQELYEFMYQNDSNLNAYISALNKKLKGEEIKLIEKGFKLVKKDD